jgi:hypothetical protein
LTSWPPETFLDESWQMSLGERAVVEGLLAQMRPGLAIEIGTAEGGSLRRIAAHSQEVHSIDIADTGVAAPENAQLHIGDSRELLPGLLRRFEAGERNVDFVFVDGDHTAEGVRADLVNLVSSTALRRTLILIHDTFNESVREGIESVGFEDFPDVQYVHLDFICGYIARSGPFAGQLWGGLGLVLVDVTAETRRGEDVQESFFFDAYSMIPIAARRQAWRRITAPLRTRGRTAGRRAR